MKKIFFNIVSIGAIAVLLSISVFAQKDKTVSSIAQNYVISAKAGGVNYVEGNVTVLRNAGKSGYLLKNDKLEIGDKVSTGRGGKAEILLNPGSYIRLAENSEFEFITTSLDDLKLKLTRGSAMLEVFADDDFRVIVNTPGAQFYAVKSGIYRVDVAENGTAKIEVWDGKAQVGDTNATVVKEGREASVSGNQVAVAKFDRDEKDSLEVWSRTRAKELAKINERLERNSLRNTLISSFRSNAWNVYDSFGLWIYDASFSGYCFLPFGYGWYSPYGYNYGRSLWNIRVPAYVYYPPPAAASNNNTGNVTRSIDRSGDSKNVPPFERIQNTGAGTKKSNPVTLDDNMNFPANVPPPVRVEIPITRTPNKATKSDN